MSNYKDDNYNIGSRRSVDDNDYCLNESRTLPIVGTDMRTFQMLSPPVLHDIPQQSAQHRGLLPVTSELSSSMRPGDIKTSFPFLSVNPGTFDTFHPGLSMERNNQMSMAGLKYVVPLSESAQDVKTVNKLTKESDLQSVPQQSPEENTQSSGGEQEQNLMNPSRLVQILSSEDVVRAASSCLLARAEEAENEGQNLVSAERAVIEEFGNCLSLMLEAAFK